MGSSAKKLRDRGVRADVDERNEKMQFKIRASQTSKIPYQWSLGTKKWKTEQSMFVATAKKKHKTISVDDFCSSYPSWYRQQITRWEIIDKTWDKILAT